MARSCGAGGGGIIKTVGFEMNEFAVPPLISSHSKTSEIIGGDWLSHQAGIKSE